MKAKKLRALLRKQLGYYKKPGSKGNGSHQRLVSDLGHSPITFAFHDTATISPRTVRAILVEQVGLTLEEAMEVVDNA